MIFVEYEFLNGLPLFQYIEKSACFEHATELRLLIATHPGEPSTLGGQ
jgi:hypothetical protein